MVPFEPARMPVLFPNVATFVIRTRDVLLPPPAATPLVPLFAATELMRFTVDGPKLPRDTNPDCALPSASLAKTLVLLKSPDNTPLAPLPEKCELVMLNRTS